jgi:hypothetical protein
LVFHLFPLSIICSAAGETPAAPTLNVPRAFRDRAA